MKYIVIAKESDGNVLIEFRDICTDIVSSCEKVHSLLETSIHKGELGKQKVGGTRKVGIQARGLIVTKVILSRIFTKKR